MTRIHRRLALAAALLLVGGFGAGAQQAPTARLQITNASGQIMDVLKVSPSSSTEWGSDLLGRLQLAPGASVFVNFPLGTECTQDVLVAYHNNTVETAERVNACAAPALNFDGSRARPVTASR